MKHKKKLSHNEKATSMRVGLLTGHCKLYKHLTNKDLTEKELQDEEKTNEDAYFVPLSRLRFLLLGKGGPTAERYVKEPLSN